MEIHFSLHSFYTRNSIYIEPDIAFVSILFLFLFCFVLFCFFVFFFFLFFVFRFVLFCFCFCFCFWVVWVSFGLVYLDQYLLVRLGLWNGNVVEVFNFFEVIYKV